MESKISELLKNGIIRESHSAWRHCPVIINKSDDSFRMYINYKPVNAVTVEDAFPIPTIDELVNQCAGMKVFSSIDFSQFYHQLPLHASDIHKTAFAVNGRLYEYVRLPFGLKNAVAYCTRIMKSLLCNMKGVIVYIDDVLICSETMEAHKKLLTEVFQKIEKAGLSLNKKKCKFFAKEISFLGFHISNGEIKPDEKRIAPLQNWPAPRNRKARETLETLIGFINYYINFVNILHNYLHHCIV